MPVLFPKGSDRRTSARIPLSGAVRMGPPSGEPYANVSARDISVGGLFIDADRAVKVGARFSTEIALGNGTKLYVPEAEVAYNRDRPHGSGFGVRFIDPPMELVGAIEREIEKTHAAIARVPSLPPVSVIEVLQEQAVENATEIVVRDTLPPLPREPGLGDETFDIESQMPERIPAWWEDWMNVGHDLKARVLERSRRVPLLWTTLAITGGVLVVSAIGLALWSGTRAEAVEPVKLQDRGVTAATHHVLMGEQPLPDMVAPPKEIVAAAPVVEVKKPLPPLVTVERLEKKTTPKPTKDLKTKIALAPNAKVLKTHVLKAPDRFVIDVVGQDKAPVMPSVSGAIKSIRFGKHPEFSRIVIETSGAIDNGRASKKGPELSVAIELR